MNGNKFFSGLIIGLIVGAAVGAGAIWFLFPPGGPAGPSLATIKTAGSTTVYPLSQVWAEEYHNVYENTTIEVSSGGSGFGQTAVGAGDIDIGASSSPIKSANLVTYPGLKQIPVALDGLAVILNVGVNGSGVQKFTREMVIAIYQENVTTWEELETGYGVSILQTGTINAYARSDASGTTDTFSRWLETNDTFWVYGHGETVSWSSGVTSVQGNPGVATAVTVDDSGIGYVGLAFANETDNPDIIGCYLLNPTTGEYVKASYDSVKTAVPTIITDSSQSLFNADVSGAYPIARMLFYVLNNETVEYKSIKYVRWCLTEGQDFVRDVGYVEINGTAIVAFSQGILDDLTALT